MAVTRVQDVADQVQEFWSPMFMPELLERTVLASLVNREYEGDLKQQGDTVRVSQIIRPTGETKTVGVDSDSFNPEKLQTRKVRVRAEKRFVASFEFEDLVDLQSQIQSDDSPIRSALLESVEIQLNNYLYGLIAPSASAPDHILTGVTDFNAAQVNSLRKLASQAKWPRDGQWWLLADPQYYSDMLDSSTLTSADFIQDRPVVGGQIIGQRYGYNIVEDNSAGLVTLSASSEDAAIAFHKDFMLLVMQQQPRFKLSDKHSNNQFGYVLSVDMVGGAKLSPEGDKMHISVINS